MTRRKATRGKVKSLKTVDPDASIAADGEDQQRVKKEAFLRDFDLQGMSEDKLLFVIVIDDLELFMK